MKTTVAILASLVIWITAAAPASAADAVPQGFDEAICKMFPWLCPR
jgi:hypothetical protein